jgi:HPt (histidine-containing phosphotransfer) domain-containing protein
MTAWRNGMAAQGEKRIAASKAQAGRAPINVDYLAKQTLGDHGLEQEVLRLFDVMAQTYMERLEASTTREALLQHLHTLKGAAAGIGAFTLSEMAREVEAGLTSGDPIDPERIDDLRMAVEEVSAFISVRLEAEA